MVCDCVTVLHCGTQSHNDCGYGVTCSYMLLVVCGYNGGDQSSGSAWYAGSEWGMRGVYGEVGCSVCIWRDYIQIRLGWDVMELYCCSSEGACRLSEGV